MKNKSDFTQEDKDRKEIPLLPCPLHGCMPFAALRETKG